MSDFMYFSILYSMAAFLLFGAYLCRMKHEKLANAVGWLQMLSSLTMLAASGYMLAQDETVAYIFRALYYLGVDLCVWSLLVFTEIYTGVFHRDPKKDRFYQIFVAVDSASMLINIFVHHEMVLIPTKASYERLYFMVSGRGVMYYVHDVVFYTMSALLLLVFLYKTVNVSVFNRMRYMPILVLLGIAGFTNLILLRKGMTVDYSLLIYGIVAVVIYYICLIYVPKGMQNQLLYRISKDMNRGLLCFDAKGKVIFINDMARDIFQTRKNPSKMDAYYNIWLKENKYPETKTWMEEFQQEDNTYHFEVTYERLYDEDENWIGGFFGIIDRTVEIDDIQRTEYKATHDRVTGVLNRESYLEEVNKTLKDHPNTEYYMLVSDIKDFKLVNDLFGVEKGNEALCCEAEMIRKFAHEGSVYGRIAPDQFACLVEKKQYSESLLLDSIYRMGNRFTNNVYRMQIYLGVYEVQSHDEDASVMCDKCIMALSELKGEVGRVISYYDSSLMDETLKENAIISEFSKALDENQFVMYLQSQNDIKGNMLGAEALVRWNHPKQGLVSPVDFMEPLEKSGLIKQLDIFMWTEAVKKLKEWKQAGITDTYISVNISAKDFFYVDIYKTLTSLVDYYNVSPKNLKLELTETTIMTDLSSTLPLINRLRRFGFEIEIDDFGSGYSSLNMLKDIQADVLKIDMGFLRETENRERSRDILDSVIGLSMKLGMPVVAEGVETEEQLDMLQNMGCDYYQGYYFSKPLPVEEFEEKYFGNRINVI